MIDGAPKIVGFAIDPHEHLTQVPAPVRKGMDSDPALPDFCCEHRTKPIPSVLNRLVTDIDAPFEEHILDLKK
tara:strand:- start:17444 stop:17662 length:219 start_codon:yes stop_codon:yes gene_type:complete